MKYGQWLGFVGSMGMMLVLPQGAMAAQPSATEAVDALEKKFGVVQARRRNHTKGQCFTGEFVPSAQAVAMTKSPIFSGKASEVVGRFSHAGGNAMAPDNGSKVFGMAMRFTKEGALHQMAMLNLPFFDVASPEAFVAKIRAVTPEAGSNKPNPAKVAAFHEKYPETQKIKAYLKGKNRVPQSYANQRFNSIHSFVLTNQAGEQQTVRWSFMPEAGVKWRSGEASADFLADEMAQRLKKGPVHYQMQVVLPAKGDAINDPTELWQGSGKPVNFGRLSISAIGGSVCQDVNFDPLVLSEGFAPSDDPVLKFRSPAYAVSFGKRLAEKSVAKGAHASH